MGKQKKRIWEREACPGRMVLWKEKRKKQEKEKGRALGIFLAAGVGQKKKKNSLGGRENLNAKEEKERFAKGQGEGGKKNLPNDFAREKSQARKGGRWLVNDRKKCGGGGFH